MRAPVPYREPQVSQEAPASIGYAATDYSFGLQMKSLGQGTPCEARTRKRYEIRAQANGARCIELEEAIDRVHSSVLARPLAN